jgi:hypothetical protein
MKLLAGDVLLVQVDDLVRGKVEIGPPAHQGDIPGQEE